MGQVAVNVNGRSYRFDCGDGEEARLEALAADIRQRIEALTREYGQVGAERLMLMAALMINDELWDARQAGAAMSGNERADAPERASDSGDAKSRAEPRSTRQAKAHENLSKRQPDAGKPAPAVRSASGDGPAAREGEARATAEKREQDAIRSQYQRKAASGEA